MVLGDRDGSQPADATCLQGVNHAEGQDIVAVVADVGVKDQGNWNSGRGRLSGRGRQSKTAGETAGEKYEAPGTAHRNRLEETKDVN
jgi:hypothetical protein